MNSEALGRVFEKGDIIIQQGDVGDCMYVMQEGRAEVYLEQDGQRKPLRIVTAGEMIGEMSIFESETRSATVRAIERVRVLTVDKKNFLRRIHEDPTLAIRIVQAMSRRVRELSALAQPPADDSTGS